MQLTREDISLENAGREGVGAPLAIPRPPREQVVNSCDKRICPAYLLHDATVAPGQDAHKFLV